MPGHYIVNAAQSDHCCEHPDGNGFLISPFLPRSSHIFIPASDDCDNTTFISAFLQNGTGTMFSLPAESTLQESHRTEVLEIINIEKSGRLEKAVAARCKLQKNPDEDPNQMFSRICNAYPEAFVFLFTTPETGTWIGATPELLLAGKGYLLRSMSLAGTRPAHFKGDWDDKNIREQLIVTHYISDIFREYGIMPGLEGPVTRQAGPVEHLQTIISGITKDITDIPAIIDALSPTPALCGIPRELAVKTITALETFQRGCYGGFCGPWLSGHEFSLFVVLRCARITPDVMVLYAGGGIMPDSNPDSEWLETERKLLTLADIFGSKDELTASDIE